MHTAVYAQVYSNRGLARHKLGDQVGAAEDFAAAARWFAKKGDFALHKQAQGNLDKVLRLVG
ncbi:hypothetical protein [Gloeobacter morelensis]|uniref:Uncharacterized protein n=1 Tax=Gloeobacter morelensis MG652769 TaxID=2781736 RepID=A0ABY3PL97_9CYAN|nr:hypothetical protein [Gloeobacter morelensis]UFP94338.1 hypothetical protein ISF26_21755 [Gloeobacter morelensis MG652769]